MTQAAYARSIATQIAVAAPTIAATVAFGPLAGVAAFAACVVAATLIHLGRTSDDVDRLCARIDQQLDDRERDQEQAARDALRVQRTLHAEPQAPVIDFFSGDRIA